MFWATDDYATMINFGKKQQSGAIQGALSAINEVYLNNTLYLDKDSIGASFGKKTVTVISTSLNIISIVHL